MEKLLIAIDGIENLIAELQLQWQVECYLVPTETTCRIHSHPERNVHEVWVNPGSAEDADELAVNLCHELCHAKLGETVDSQFCYWRFSRRYTASAAGEAELQSKAHMFYVAAAHIDVWVDDLRHSHWPELTQLDHDLSEQAMLAIAQQAPQAILKNPELFMAVCVHLAAAQRHGFPSGLRQVLKVYDRHPRRLIREMADYYAKLPPLSGVAETDLRLYEQSVRHTAKALRLPINPRLVHEDNAWVWTL